MSESGLRHSEKVYIAFCLACFAADTTFTTWEIMVVTINTLTHKNEAHLISLEERLGYSFSDRTLLVQALIHSSWAAENNFPAIKNNERLEFLGDAVLDLAVGAALYRRFVEMREGDLSRLRSGLVNAAHLALMAEELSLGDHLLLGKGEDSSDGRRKPSILACAYEAVVGAIFLDGGHAAAESFVEKHFAGHLDQGKEVMLQGDAKSRLQEESQERFGLTPSYSLENEEGPDHAKFFTVSVRIGDQVLANGSGSSKKEAEQQAAATALQDFADFVLEC